MAGQVNESEQFEGFKSNGNYLFVNRVVCTCVWCLCPCCHLLLCHFVSQLAILIWKTKCFAIMKRVAEWLRCWTWDPGVKGSIPTALVVLKTLASLNPHSIWPPALMGTWCTNTRLDQYVLGAPMWQRRASRGKESDEHGCLHIRI